MIGHEPVNLQVKPTTLYSSPTGWTGLGVLPPPLCPALLKAVVKNAARTDLDEVGLKRA
jgi:hypothetical protein